MKFHSTDTTDWKLFNVYKTHGAHFHRHMPMTDPAFIVDLSKAFAYIDVTTADLDVLDDDLNKEWVAISCSGFLSSIDYVPRTRPKMGTI